MSASKIIKDLFFASGVLGCCFLLLICVHRKGLPPRDSCQSVKPIAPNPPSREKLEDASFERIRSACEFFKSSHTPVAARERLEELRAFLAGLDRKEAVRPVREFLDSKEDAVTRLRFKIASGGLLEEAPTFRVFLIDELSRLDAAAAADYSKVLLSGKDSSDEWALALRNLARGELSDAGRTLLEQKTDELLEYQAWQTAPSTGYLEAFDAAVQLGGTNLMPSLSSLIRATNNPAVTHAAYLAMDRLIINDPARILAALAASPASLHGRESARADFFARADVRDPAQRRILEKYLLDSNLSPAELTVFAGVYPNANYMVSANLMTPVSIPNHATLDARDHTALAVAKQWLSDHRFTTVQPALNTIVSRLEIFSDQAGQQPAGRERLSISGK